MTIFKAIPTTKVPLKIKYLFLIFPKGLFAKKASFAAYMKHINASAKPATLMIISPTPES